MLLPAGPIPRCAAERVCLGGRLEPRVRSPPAASHEAAAGPRHPEHGVPLHQPAEHVCLQQRLLVHGYAHCVTAAPFARCSRAHSVTAGPCVRCSHAHYVTAGSWVVQL